MHPHTYACDTRFNRYGVRTFCDCTTQTSDQALADLRERLAGDYIPAPLAQQDDCMLTVVFTNGDTASVPIMVPTSGEAVVMRDGMVLAENRAMRCYTFPNVSYWYTDAI